MEIIQGLAALAIIVILGIAIGEGVVWVVSVVLSYIEERNIRRQEIQEEKDKLWNEVVKIEAEKRDRQLH